MLKMLLHNAYPIEKLSLELGRRADICRWPWTRTGLMRLLFQLDIGPPLCLMVVACQAQPFILSGFASIPRLLTIKPKNFPAKTPKAHLARFNFMLYSLRIWKASDI